jgi:hypothetical protein
MYPTQVDCQLDSRWVRARSKSVRADSLVRLLLSVAYLSLTGAERPQQLLKRALCAEFHIKVTLKGPTGQIGLAREWYHWKA